jgi:NADH-quinone oxidoreductase subunit D
MDGGPEFQLEVVDGIVRAARVEIGMVHRGAEKLFESRDYRAGLALADRHDWLGSFCSEVGLALAVEALAGIRVPERAALIRVALSELTRVGHHLAFLAPLPAINPGGAAADPGWSAQLWGIREEGLRLMESATGQRIHPMFVVVGGVRQDVGAAWLAELAAAVGAWRTQLATALAQPLEQRLVGYEGIGVLARDRARSFGASGPVGRASGIDLDLRRDVPYLPYPTLRVPVSNAGDARARVHCLAQEIPVSLGIIDWAITTLAEVAGPVNVRLPKVVRAPEGRVYVATENPSGINGYFLVSRNEPMPYRLKLRTAGFAHAAALQALLPGTAEAAVPGVVASMFLVPGDVDR